MQPISFKVNAIKPDGSEEGASFTTMEEALKEVDALKAEGYVVVSITTYY